MPIITLPNVRIENDVRINTSLRDNGARVDWNSLTDIFAALYSDTQRQMAGPCTVHIDPEDGETLICNYGANQPQYLGQQRLVVRCKYNGRKKTYDIPAFIFVPETAGLSGEELEISDPEVDVQLEVREVSTSLLDEAIDACIAATQTALESAAAADFAAGHGPIIVDNYWHVWSVEQGRYINSNVEARGHDGLTPHIDETTGRWFIGATDTGVAAQGPQGPQGLSGDLNYPTLRIDGDMHLRASALTEGSVSRFSLDEGHLKLTI